MPRSARTPRRPADRSRRTRERVAGFTRFGGVGRSIVLVHGAWHGAWAWERVLPLLTAAGVACRALDLPGHGEDGGPFGDLDADIARVRETLDEVDGDAVLVGHSYGG